MSFPIRVLTAAISLLGILAGPATAGGTQKILTMGDSLMASHGISQRAIPDAIENALDVKVEDHSFMGARILYKLPITGRLGLSIPKQYRRGDWDWVVVNGGGNDLWMGCGCLRCTRKMNKLIGENGKGGIPKLITKLRRGGARVIYLGYLRSPGLGSPIEHCKDEGNELERRIEEYAQKDDGVYFLSLADLVPFGDSSYHAVDMIHPSLKASREIGQRIARIIAE